MRRACVLGAVLLTALPPGIASALTVQSNQIAVTASQSAGSDLPADRNAQRNWHMAGLLSVGGIPVRNTVCATVNPKGGGADDTNVINTAIRKCPAGDVVLLGPGTFTIGEGNYVLVDKGITLRGAGPGVTVLQRANGARLGSYNPGAAPSPIIIAGPQRWNNAETATALTARAVRGRSSVQVANATGFSKGQFVLIDEAMGGSWQKDPEGFSQKVWAAGTYPNYELVYPDHNPQRGCDGASGRLPTQANGPGDWFSNLDRFTNEIKQVVSVAGNTITFDSPLTSDYRVYHKAQLHSFRTAFTQNAGVESLTAEYGDNDDIEFIWCADCYAYKVETTLWLGAGFSIYYGFRDQLEEVYAHKPVWPVPGGDGYNISLADGSSEVLVENSISVLANKVDVVRASGAGSVFAYNYMDDGYINASSGGNGAWVETGINGSHMIGSHHILFEGNEAFDGDEDGTWGSAVKQTFFRNWFTGFRAPFTAYLSNTTVNDLTNQPGNNGPLRAASLMNWAYYNSYIGNVLGTFGHMSGWVYSDPTAATPAILTLGWDICNHATDPEVSVTAIIHGNYDYVQNQVTWDPSIPDHTLPKSLYLSSKPAFFNTGRGYKWPWVDPINGVVYTLPAKVRYDAGTPFTQP